MKYNDFKISYDKPFIWRRPTIEKLLKKGKSFNDFQAETDEFETLKREAGKEITSNVVKQINLSQSRNELNKRLEDVFDYYGKALVATDDIDPNFLLNKTNKNTLNKKLQGWCRNLVYNIPEIISSIPYEKLIGKFPNVPAFVVLAGPSLKNNREKLKEIKGKAIIVAVDTSLRPLLDVGIVPDICVTHDANPNGCKFFLSKDHPFNRDNIQLNDMSDEEIGSAYAMLQADKERLKFKYDTLGLFVNYCHPLSLLAWNGGAKRFYGVYDPTLPVYDIMASSGNYHVDKDNKLTPENKGRVIGGSSVGHVAEYIAIALGCNPISFLGLDLSYPEGKTYVEGASNQKDVSKQKLIDMDSLSGERVKTNLSMLSYKMVFERTFPHILMQKPELRFYNCTQDDKGRTCGILELGAEPKSLDWVIKNKCRKDVKFNYVGDKKK